MRRRSRASSKPTKARSRKAKTIKRTVLAVRRSSSSAPGQETEVAGLRRELSEALEQQTATSEVLRVIARSPTDAQPAFEAMVARAARLCEADFSAVARFENGLLHLVAMNNLSPAEREAFDRLFPRPPERNFVMGRAFIDGVSVQFEDVLADLTYDPRTREVLQRLLGYRTFMAVPIIRNGKPIGAIGCGRRKVMPFTARQIALVQTFADQALIAVENTRLFEAEQQRTRELSESLEQQTATSEVLRVISNSFSDIQPVFESIVQSGVKLFSGAVVSIALVDNDMVRAAAVAHSDLDHAEAWRGVFPFPLTREYMHSRAILDRKVVDIPDVECAPADLAVGAKNFLRSGQRAVTVVPLMQGDRAIGALSVIRLAPGPLSDKQLATLKTYADQAIIAIENTRLLNELRQSLQQQTATADVLKVISSSPGDLRPVFDAMLAKATELCEASYGLMWLREKDAFRAAALLA